MEHLKQYLIDEYVEHYLDRQLTRREALRYLTAIAGSSTLAATILAACGPQRAPEPQATSAPATPTSAPAATPTTVAAASGAYDPKVSATDPAIEGQRVEFTGTGATIIGYMAKPKGVGPFKAVLVCHENRGMLEHTQDVTRRLAKAGYVGLAVDLLSRQGGTDKITDAAQVPGILGTTPGEQFIGDFQSGWRYLQTQPYVRKEGVGMVGYCFGGGVTWLVATKLPELKAAVPFYGPNPPLTDVPNIKAAVLAMYGETDQRINAGIPAMEEAMKKENKTFEKMIYPNAGHAFYNDTGRAYNPEASKDAWEKTLAWFGKYL